MRSFLALALALAVALLIAGGANARPFTVQDLLGLEQLGPVQMAPGGRWAVIQTFAPWDTAPAYDLDWWTLYGLGRLRRVSLGDGAVRPLLQADPACGYVAGPISPSGTRLAVGRLCGHAWTLGVVELESGAARWFTVAPEVAMWGREVAWRGEDELLVVAQPDAPLGQRMGLGWQGLERLKAAWAEAAAGRRSVTVLGSGRYRDLRAKGPPRRLLRITLSTGLIRTLAVGDFLDMELAPDGRTAALLAGGGDLHDPRGPTATGTRRRRLVLVDLRSGKAVGPAPPDVHPDLLTWSPAGDRLLVFARVQPGAAWRYEIVDAATGRAEPVETPGLQPASAGARAGDGAPAAAWLGGAPAVFARTVATPHRSDWYLVTPRGPKRLTGALETPSPRLVAASRDRLVVSDGPRLWRIGLSGPARLLSPTLADVFCLRPAPESERLASIPPAPDDLAMRRGADLSPFAAGGRSRLAIAAHEIPLAVAKGLQGAIVARRDAHGVQRLSLRRTDGSAVPLLTLNGALAAVDPAVVRPIRHPGPDGQPLTSWLYLPPALAPGARAPLVVVPYPGETNATPPASQAPGSTRLYVNAQLLAGAGYAVLVPSLPYAKGREPMQALADQVLAAVDAAAAQAPVDPARLAVWGHSYGGYAALALATESPRFRAVVAGAPVANLTSFYATLSPYSYAVPEGGLSVMGSAAWAEIGQGRMGVPPWVDPDLYARNSPIRFVDRITAPVMLIVGDQDNDPTQAEQMFTSLYRLDRDAVLLVYHGESHVVSGPGNVRDLYGRALAFLAENVAPMAQAGAVSQSGGPGTQAPWTNWTKFPSWSNGASR